MKTEDIKDFYYLSTIIDRKKLNKYIRGKLISVLPEDLILSLLKLSIYSFREGVQMGPNGNADCEVEDLVEEAKEVDNYNSSEVYQEEHLTPMEEDDGAIPTVCNFIALFKLYNRKDFYLAEKDEEEDLYSIGLGVEVDIDASKNIEFSHVWVYDGTDEVDFIGQRYEPKSDSNFLLTLNNQIIEAVEWATKKLREKRIEK